ncbi:hypothetical protein NL676_027313 [Syzygium grande]|nr:hypothetical protein NL676_027313 [Syzygium grande]
MQAADPAARPSGRGAQKAEGTPTQKRNRPPPKNANNCTEERRRTPKVAKSRLIKTCNRDREDGDWFDLEK